MARRTLLLEPVFLHHRLRFVSDPKFEQIVNGHHELRIAHYRALTRRTGHKSTILILVIKYTN